MEIKINKIPAVLLSALTLLFTSCKKEFSQLDAATQKNYSEQLSLATIESAQVFDDVFNNVMGVNSEVALGETGIFGRIITVDSSSNPCLTVRITRLSAPAAFPIQADLDFGTGCNCKDGIFRKGKITIIYNGRLAQAGKRADIFFNDFYINDTRIEGHQQIENVSTTQQVTYKETIMDGKITKLNGNFYLWNSNNTIRQIDGFATPNFAKDDVMAITSTSNGSIKTDSIFLKWSAQTTEPLIKKFSCPWPVKGKLETLGSNANATIIDFGNGECDNKANLIINNYTTEITLH